MTRTIQVSLLSDGSSDRQLLPLIEWVLRQFTSAPIRSTWANLSVLGERPRTLTERVRSALEFYPCDILFIHRDAEGEAWEARRNEIRRAVESVPDIRYVGVVPVRMQEAWFLFNERALRYAADNPNGSVRLTLPALNRVEQLPDPKEVLFSLLRQASEYRGRRLKQFRPQHHAYRLGELVQDFSPLRQLEAFRHFESEARVAISSIEAPP